MRRNAPATARVAICSTGFQPVPSGLARVENPCYRKRINRMTPRRPSRLLLHAALICGAVVMLAPLPYVIARAVVSLAVSLFYTYPLHTRFVFRVVR